MAGNAYQSETAITPGGGGLISLDLPSYQNAAIMTAAGGSATLRNVPDVSISADNPEVLFSPTAGWPGAGGQYSIGVWGTSLGGPSWAGIMALANQQSEINNLGRVGFPNPALYAFSQSQADYATTFNDITSGEIDYITTTTDSTGKSTTTSTLAYSAVTGYDLATGLGSPRCGLLTKLGGAPRKVVVTAELSDFNYHTTGFNVFNHDPNKQTVPGTQDGILTVTCEPKMVNANTLSQDLITVPQIDLGCHDGWGFQLGMTCQGTTGTPGDLGVTATLRVMITNSCNVSSVAQTTPWTEQIGIDQTIVDPTSLNVCESGFNLDPTVSACSRQQFEARSVTLRNTLVIAQ
jgi:subtilase family serine protease